jgi:hypothetical protein
MSKSGDSILKMEKASFNHKKELKQLFAKAMNAQGAKNVSLSEETKDEP